MAPWIISILIIPGMHLELKNLACTGGTSVAQWSRWLAIFQRKPSSNLVEAHSSFFSSFLTLVEFGGPVFDLEISRTGKLEWKGRFQDLVHWQSTVARFKYRIRYLSTYPGTGYTVPPWRCVNNYVNDKYLQINRKAWSLIKIWAGWITLPRRFRSRIPELFKLFCLLHRLTAGNA